MEHKDYLTRITELSSKISEMPKGYISKKTVSGNIYFYHQWTEGGVKQSRYLHDDEVALLSAQIEERKKLQAELKEVKAEMTRQPKLKQSDEQRIEVTHLNCTLMHKRIAVAELELDNDTGFIQKIGTVYAPEHLPLGIPIRKGITDRKALNEWWTDRSIPASRSGVREALETLDITSTRMLLIKCYGLSLSDQYWICPEGSGLTWEKVNFFNNGFSDDIGNVLFGSNKKPSNPLDFSSPDNTSDGNLKKRWKIIDGKRCLVKGGSNPFRQQPLNEVIATEIMERLDIPHVPYTVIRYADDIVLLAKSERATERLLETSSRYLEDKLKLTVNREKSRAVSVTAIRNFKFLGFALGRGKDGYFIRVHAKSLKKAKQNLKELTSRSQGRNVRVVMHNLKVYMTGWLAYFGIARIKETLRGWNGWLRRRIRMYIWKQWKNPKTRVQNLMKLGMEPWKAHRNGNTRKGYWAVAGSGILTHTITDKRLAQAGYFDILAKYESLHC